MANNRELQIRSVGSEDDRHCSPQRQRQVFHERSTETEVGGTDNGDADVRLVTAKGGRMGAQPFLTEKLSNGHQGVDCAAPCLHTRNRLVKTSFCHGHTGLKWHGAL